jgi:hypothetical protein
LGLSPFPGRPTAGFEWIKLYDPDDAPGDAQVLDVVAQRPRLEVT